MIRLVNKDCVEAMRLLPDCSVDSIVTDPPYGLGFMGKEWDIGTPAVDVFVECLRVLKPGGHLLAFGGSRTYHRLAVAVEDAGFEIRDQIMWVYGSGFPKSRNVGKEVEEWAGWGTALKPAHEPIVVARKPLTGTVVENVLAHGTGVLNIDGCRVEPTGESREREGEASQDKRYIDAGCVNLAAKPGIRGGSPNGRWPANLIHDGSDEVIGLFPQTQSGTMKAGTRRAAQDEPGSVCYGTYGGNATTSDTPGDAGSAARFFYCAKASRKDRHEGLNDPGPQFKRGTTLRKVESTSTQGNSHPTVKPTELMRYLCRLVTPPKGVVLDPFMGSGSTGKAAIIEGFSFLGVEKDPEYFAIAKQRIAAAKEQANASR